MTLAITILAAGASSRMGRPKLLLPWGATSILGHIIEQWRILGAMQIVVVARPGDAPLREEMIRLGHLSESSRKPPSDGAPLINTPLQRGEICHNAERTASAVSTPPGTSVIENPDPDRGMFSSIQCAARWAGWNSAILSHGVVLCDQPHIRIESLRELLLFHTMNSEAICQPFFEGRARHPVLLPKSAFDELKTTRAADLKDFLRLTPHRKAPCPINDPGLALDLDTPEDYVRARSRFQPGGLADGSRGSPGDPRSAIR